MILWVLEKFEALTLQRAIRDVVQAKDNEHEIIAECMMALSPIYHR